MKNLALFLILFLSIGCVSHFESPITHTEYTGTINEEGVGITAKPPLWDLVVYCWEYITSD